jgi:hypothetical protein
MPATVPGSSPAPDMSATVPKKQIQEVGQCISLIQEDLKDHGSLSKHGDQNQGTSK